MKRGNVQEFHKVIYSGNPTYFKKLRPLIIDIQNCLVRTSLNIVLLIWIKVVDLALVGHFRSRGFPRLECRYHSKSVKITFYDVLKKYRKLPFSSILFYLPSKIIFVLMLIILDAYILNRLILGGLAVLLIWIHTFQLRKIFKISLMKFYFL